MSAVFVLFFLFEQKTAYGMRSSDERSDVCSSDLHCPELVRRYPCRDGGWRSSKLPESKGEFEHGILIGQHQRHDIVFADAKTLQSAGAAVDACRHVPP